MNSDAAAGRDVADGAAVDAARLGFELADQLHGADLGRPDDGAGREDAAQQLRRVDTLLQSGAHAGRHLVQGLVGLDGEQVGDVDAADLGDAPDVVAHQIDDHQVLGALLDVRRQLLAAPAASASSVPARGAVPFIGRVNTVRPSCSMNSSGDADSTVTSPVSTMPP